MPGNQRGMLACGAVFDIRAGRVRYMFDMWGVFSVGIGVDVLMC